MKAVHVSEAVGPNLYAPLGSLVHDAEGTTIRLRPASSSSSSGGGGGNTDDDETLSVRAKVVVDCTGSETKLVLPDIRSATPAPGFHIAYGALESKSPDKTHIRPYDKEAMTLFDYRTDHFELDSPKVTKRAGDVPTFMYAMPLEENRTFFEDTSLVARPAVSILECKERCFKRLAHLGIQVTGVEEEEFCYIPMGGPLPMKDQRIV